MSGKRRIIELHEKHPSWHTGMIAAAARVTSNRVWAVAHECGLDIPHNNERRRGPKPRGGLVA